MTVGDAWSAREVWYTLFPKNPRLGEDLDKGIDILADYFYSDARQVLFLMGGGAVSSRERTLIVSGFRRWVPGWLARRLVVRLMEDANLAGSAIFVVERTFLGREREAEIEGT